jgi:glycosyltransferase involved in cell wall biosynthesis
MRQRRLAWLTPVPPAATGIADYSTEVIALLADRHRVEVFHDQDEVDSGALPASCRRFRAHLLLERHRAEPYDLAVYQMGNSAHHAFLYDLVPRMPGLLVLHDLVLHHSRARAFLDSAVARAYAREPWDSGRREEARALVDRYRAEIAYVYPDQAGRLVEVQLGTVGHLLPYAYPLFRLPVEASRLTAVHNRFMAAAIGDESPRAPVARVAMPAVPAPVKAQEVAALRARLGIRPDELVVGSFGLMTREKRIETVARAVARAASALPVRLLLVGPVPDPPALAALLERTGVAARTVVTGRVPFGELPSHMEATDIVVHLRYPTARETSAALLRVLAQGRPAIVSDLEHLADLPTDAVVRVDVNDEEGEVTRAVLRLGQRPMARRRLGDNAAAFMEREHSPERCREGYEAAIEQAIALPDPPPRPWPPHWARLQRR